MRHLVIPVVSILLNTQGWGFLEVLDRLTVVLASRLLGAGVQRSGWALLSMQQPLKKYLRYMTVLVLVGKSWWSWALVHLFSDIRISGSAQFLPWQWLRVHGLVQLGLKHNAQVTGLMKKKLWGFIYPLLMILATNQAANSPISRVLWSMVFIPNVKQRSLFD